MRPARPVFGSLIPCLKWKATRCHWTRIRQLHFATKDVIRKSVETQDSICVVDLRRPRVRGLDLSLPPMSDLADMFRDLTENAGRNGFYTSIDALSGRRIRLATMCSGLESPILAIEMIQDALISLGRQKLEIEHVFSAENVSFKQALIGNNFGQSTIFRDIIEVADVINDPQPMATNAYGIKVPVPKDVDVLIAGTSCVDFSGNNAHRKGIDDGGESGNTFNAVVTFCEASKPSFVIIENVRTAPWPTMGSRFEAIGYSVMRVLVDTKDYYLPQTRERGYMVCINVNKAGLAAAKAAAQEYSVLMGKLRRRASSPVSDFLLPGEPTKLLDPLPPRNWDIEKSKHYKYRQKHRLGDGHPITRSRTGLCHLPDHADAPSINRESARAQDRIDMDQLSKARVGYDAMYKDWSLNLHESISRVTLSPSHGISPCITPQQQIYETSVGRLRRPEEALVLQGIPLNRVALPTETPPQTMNLAGNTMSTTVICAAILSAFTAGLPQLNADIPFTATTENTRQSQPKWVFGKQVELLMQIIEPSTIDMKELLHQAEQASRACYCEYSEGLTDHSLQKCIDCGETTCTGCGGKPEHNYAPVLRSRLSPKAFEKYVRSALPLYLRLPSSLGNLLKPKQTGLPDFYCHALRKVANSTFSLERIRRTQHGSTIVYRSASARLNLVLGDGKAEWRVYAEPNMHLASNAKLRSFLKQPLIKANAIDRFEGTHWQLRRPEERNLPMAVRGSGCLVASWWARLALPGLEDHRVWEYLHIEVPGDLSTVLSGKYQYLPRCGTACESLYKRVDCDGAPVYFFLDSGLISHSEEDCFVLSYNKSRPDKDEARPIIARVAAGWRPWSFEQGCPEVQETSLHTDSTWKAMSNSWKLRAATETRCDISQAADLLALPEPIDCSQFVGVVSCTIPSNLLSGQIPDNGMIKPTDYGFYKSNSHLFESIRQQCSSNQWQPLSSHCIAFEDCSSCNPTPPASGHLVSAAAYDRAMRARPKTTAIRVTEASGRTMVTLGVNIASLAHRAYSRLPKNARNPQYGWRLLGDDEEKGGTNNSDLHLEDMPDIDGNDIASTTPNISLLPNQRRHLAWMKAQERGTDFNVETIQDSVMKPSNLVVEVRARGTVTICGGICAAQPGFGKSIVSLALIQSELPREPKDLDKVNESLLTALIPTRATIIVCSATSFKQWVDEVDKLQMTEGAIAIEATANLDKFTVADFENAKLVVVSKDVLTYESYTKRLASFAAVPGPASQSGRAYSRWRSTVSERLPDSLAVFRRNGSDGLSLTKEHLKDAYQAYMRSDFFRPGKGSEELGSLSMKHIGKPLLEMFYFNRMIVDEGHSLGPEDYAAIAELKALKRWVLSSTPDIDDLHQVSKMVRLLGVELPVGLTVNKPVRTTPATEMSFSERVDAGRETVSDSRLGHMRRQLGRFLHKFGRQSTIDTPDLSQSETLREREGTAMKISRTWQTHTADKPTKTKELDGDGEHRIHRI